MKNRQSTSSLPHILIGLLMLIPPLLTQFYVEAPAETEEAAIAIGKSR